MEARPAEAGDREGAMAICRASYPGGDYVEDTWGPWLAGGGLRVIWDGGRRAGIFNVTVSRGQGWVEGLRVAPGLRGRGAGALALAYSERHARAAGARVARALVLEGNAASERLAARAGWGAGPAWRWYRLRPGRPAGAFREAAPYALGRAMYADSWRVYELAPGPRVAFFAGAAVAVAPSRHFPGTALATVLRAEDLSEAAAYLRMLASRMRRPAGAAARGWEPGLHVLSPLPPGPFAAEFERVAAYRLFERRLGPGSRAGARQCINTADPAPAA